MLDSSRIKEEINNFNKGDRLLNRLRRRRRFSKVEDEDRSRKSSVDSDLNVRVSIFIDFFCVQFSHFFSC